MPQTAKCNAVPGCPRVKVLGRSRDGKEALVESDEAEPGYERFMVPVAELSSFEGEPMTGAEAAEVLNAAPNGRKSP